MRSRVNSKALRGEGSNLYADVERRRACSKSGECATPDRGGPLNPAGTTSFSPLRIICTLQYLWRSYDAVSHTKRRSQCASWAPSRQASQLVVALLHSWHMDT